MGAFYGLGTVWLPWWLISCDNKVVSQQSSSLRIFALNSKVWKAKKISFGLLMINQLWTKNKQKELWAILPSQKLRASTNEISLNGGAESSRAIPTRSESTQLWPREMKWNDYSSFKRNRGLHWISSKRCNLPRAVNGNESLLDPLG